MILYSVGEELCGIVLLATQVSPLQNQVLQNGQLELCITISSKSALRRYNVHSLPPKLRLRRQNVPNPKRT